MIVQVHYLVAFAGTWALANGVLHDIFVLLQRKPFDRDLIRLLIDGHILIFSGVIFLICVNGIHNNEPLAFYISIANALFLIGYCLLIFRMLPSWGMILINATVLLTLLATLP